MDIYTGRALAAREHTKYFDGTGTDALVVSEWPINTITKLYIDSSRAFGSSSEVASTEYSILSEEGIIVLYSKTFSHSGLRQVIKLTANLGYGTTHLKFPALNGACLEFVDWLKSRKAPGTIGKKGEYSIDRVSISYETEMPLSVKTALDDFIRRA
jgi:hypothetical protein